MAQLSAAVRAIAFAAKIPSSHSRGYFINRQRRWQD